jgi:hypothetical protein
MESLLNYLYWQTLAINQFDETSHILRTANFIQEDCSDIQNDLRTPAMGGSAEQDEIRRRCGGYLGPYQPGITAEDPTDPDGGRLGFPEGQNGGSGGQTGSPKRLQKTAPEKAGERRDAGQPAALPLPGQFDPSVPHVTLPPAIRELVEELRNGQSGGGAPNAQSTQQMLDFLLAP